MIRLLCSLLTLATLAAITPVPRRTRSAQPPEVWAFTGPWEAESDASVRANASKLDAVVTGWIALDSTSAQPILPSLFPDTIRPLARTAAGSRRRPTTTRRMAIVTSWHGDRFHPETIRRLARQPEMLARAASAIASHAEQMSYRGLVLDFESLEPADVPALIRVVRAVADSAHAKGISPVTLAIPAADSEGYPTRALLGATDLLLVMLYDQHWAESEPGPIAEPTWVRETLARRVADAGLLRVLLDEVKREGVYRVALWRLGQEDPGIWSVLGTGR